MLEPDPNLVEIARDEHRNMKRGEGERVGEGYCPTELDESLDMVEFEESKSAASCKLSDIQGILYGGRNSRFWMLRKHINTLPRDRLNTVPFYCWNCVTL